MNNILEQNLKTYITRDYSVFKYLSGNREINLHNVNNIVKNVLNNGLLPTIVIVNENMEVIDGQHRIEAFKQLNLPVEFQIRKGLGLKDCIAYNVSSKKWETVDYINSYAERGIEDYITLKKCIDELAISKGKVVECCAIPCSECDFEDKNGHCIGNHEIMKWLKQPYKKLPYKLSQFEFDLLNAYKNSGMRQCISNYGTLLEMYGKGHFKGIDTSTPIREILDNCKVV